MSGGGGGREGGLCETVLDGETGVLLAPGFSPETLADAVAAMTPARALATRAAAFSLPRFRESLAEAVHGTPRAPPGHSQADAPSATG